MWLWVLLYGTRGNVELHHQSRLCQWSGIDPKCTWQHGKGCWVTVALMVERSSSDWKVPSLIPDPAINMCKCLWERNCTPNCSWCSAISVWMCVWMEECKKALLVVNMTRGAPYKYGTFTCQETDSSSFSDGRGHGSTNERASQMVTGQSRVFCCPWLDRHCQTVG